SPALQEHYSRCPESERHDPGNARGGGPAHSCRLALCATRAFVGSTRLRHEILAQRRCLPETAGHGTRGRDRPGRATVLMVQRPLEVMRREETAACPMKLSCMRPRSGLRT